ncbi:MAG: GNAT family N-acetyltransferase [Elainellaceae cyanobacterium]
MTQIKVATTNDEKYQIYRFRYRIYVEEMGKQPQTTDHTKKVLIDSLDETAILLYILHNDQVIATLRRNFLDTSNLPDKLKRALSISTFTQAFPRSLISVGTKLIVAPEWRNSATVGAIVAEAYKQTRDRGVQFDFTYCAPWLIPFYENLGYRRYTDNFLDSDTGFQVPMVLVVEDIEHFRNVRSPFYRTARNMKNNFSAGHWFIEHVPQHTQFCNSSQPMAGAQIDLVDFNVLETVPLFQGVSRETVQKLLKSSTVHPLQAGETLLRFGDIGNAIFLLLFGSIEVSRQAYTTRCSTQVLEPYQTFGEASILAQPPSPERAIAQTNAEVLVIPKPTIAKVTKTSPEAMCQFYFNLSQILSKKYVPNVRESVLTTV